MGFMLQGAHRGGTRLVERIPEAVLQRHGHSLVIADPQEGRAGFLAAEAQQRFPGLKAIPLATSGQQALAFMEEDDPLVLASDSLGSLRETIGERRASQPAFWQIVGRGPGRGAGMRLGLQGTLLPGDPRATAESRLLLETLERLAPPASSRALTRTDALAATVLAPMRERVLSRTLRHLDEIGRDPDDLSGGALGIVTGATSLPLKPVPAPAEQRFSHYKELALQALDQVPENQLLDRGTLGRYLVVAVAVAAASLVHFMTLARSRQDRRRVEGLVTFAPAPAVEVPTRPVAIPRSEPSPAMFTD